MGMAVASFVEGIRSVTGKPYLAIQGAELVLFLNLLEAHVEDPTARIDWAREKGAAFARSGEAKLNVFVFKDWVQGHAKAPRVQPPAPSGRKWGTGKRDRP